MRAENRWTRLRGLQSLGQLVAGVKFVAGVRKEKPKRIEHQPQQAAA